jgi:hypothetical protein
VYYHEIKKKECIDNFGVFPASFLVKTAQFLPGVTKSIAQVAPQPVQIE